MKTMAKANTKNTAETIEQTVNAGAETVKNGFEQATKTYERLAGFGKENVEAYMKAATTMTKAFEQINGEVVAYSKQQMEDGAAALKAVMGAKSVQEAWEVQQDFAKMALDAYIAQATKLNQLFMSGAKQAAEPLNTRFAALAEVVQTARASNPFAQAAE